jgi:AcrR family transcriptional regulator
VARRPGNRKAQLADAAAELFRARGYHAVSVNDIACAAGVTGPAVYRHFGSKQAILAHVLLTGLDAFGQVTEEALADPADDPKGRVERLLRAVAALAVERREVTALWRWQATHLDKPERVQLRSRSADILGRWAVALRATRDTLAAEEAELLCWAALSVFGSVSVHHLSLPRRRFEELLTCLATQVLMSSAVPIPPVVSPNGSAPDPSWQPVTTPASRREELLSVATRLFRERGYHSVSMEDIGASAGIAGPSIYRHFASKAEILVAAGYRMADRLNVDARRVTAEAADPADALARLARSYVDTVLRSDDLLALFASMPVAVPDRDAKELRSIQRSYVAEWVRLMQEVAPAAEEREARITVHAALTIINDLTRMPRVAARPQIAEELVGLALAVLHTPST